MERSGLHLFDLEMGTAANYCERDKCKNIENGLELLLVMK
jgi:hypothetical protein